MRVCTLGQCPANDIFVDLDAEYVRELLSAKISLRA
jgi:hypothetical protein